MDNPADIGAALAAPFDAKEIKFKPSMVKNNRALAMAYIDARLIQDRLDEVVGVENWQDRYRILGDGSVVCRLSVRVGERWVTKCDVGSLSEQPDAGDRLKAAFSDALKRAAVKFGIGRYLYRLAAQWVDYDPNKKQLTQLPQLPAFALPNGKEPPAKKPAAKTPEPAPVKMATTGQVYEMRQLVEDAKLPDETIDKWFKKANAQEWADFTATQIQACITQAKIMIHDQGRR